MFTKTIASSRQARGLHTRKGQLRTAVGPPRPLPYNTKHCHAAVASHGGLTHLFAKRSVIGLQTSNMINAKHGHDHDKNDNDDADDEDASIKASMAACNVCNHAHRLSFTDGPRKGEQASITMTATNALTNTYGGGASLGTPSSATRTQRGRRGECPCAVPVGVALFFSPWGAMGSFHRTATDQAAFYHTSCTIHEHMLTKLIRLAHSVTPLTVRKTGAGPVRPHVRPTHTQKATRRIGPLTGQRQRHTVSG